MLAEEGRDSFDLIFIDADKENTPAYFEWALKLARPGSLIVVDNVVRSGAVLSPESSDASVQGIRRFHDLVAAQQRAREPRYSATAIQTVGSKGHDGFALVLVNSS